MVYNHWTHLVKWMIQGITLLGNPYGDEHGDIDSWGYFRRCPRSYLPSPSYGPLKAIENYGDLGIPPNFKKKTYSFILIWLVVWLPFLIFRCIGFRLSSQLTDSYFSEGWPNHQPVIHFNGWEYSPLLWTLPGKSTRSRGETHQPCLISRGQALNNIQFMA